MATSKAKDKVYDAAGNVKPYVDRALSDEKLRADVLSAFGTARDLYNELIASRTATTVAARVATDEEIRAKLKAAIEDLRSAANRLQGKRESDRKRGRTLLLVGILIGILFNPITGPDTRKWIKDTVSGGSDEFGEDFPPSANGGV
ncbi:MAG TPA: hypothetical protein VLV46_12865 [Gaiellaceae bacterium]|nr:hypothetical protein [Gaiellaceae bacterium]